MITRWSSCSSRMLSIGNVSICWRIACEIAGRKCAGFRSRSSQSISANCSGVISCSAIQYVTTEWHCHHQYKLQTPTFVKHVFIHLTATSITSSFCLTGLFVWWSLQVRPYSQRSSKEEPLVAADADTLPDSQTTVKALNATSYIHHTHTPF